MTGVIILILALAAATAAGAVMRRRAGQVRSYPRTDRPGSPLPSSSPALTAVDLGEPLGERATLVQFSTEFCTYCGPARKLLGELADGRPGVAVIEVDAAERMELTRRLRVLSTPTVFVLGPDGLVAARATGKPVKAELSQSLHSVLGEGVRS